MYDVREFEEEIFKKAYLYVKLIDYINYKLAETAKLMKDDKIKCEDVILVREARFNYYNELLRFVGEPTVSKDDINVDAKDIMDHNGIVDELLFGKKG